jgi:hypothetical protein
MSLIESTSTRRYSHPLFFHHDYGMSRAVFDNLVAIWKVFLDSVSHISRFTFAKNVEMNFVKIESSDKILKAEYSRSLIPEFPVVGQFGMRKFFTVIEALIHSRPPLVGDSVSSSRDWIGSNFGKDLLGYIRPKKFRWHARHSINNKESILSEFNHLAGDGIGKIQNLAVNSGNDVVVKEGNVKDRAVLNVLPKRKCRRKQRCKHTLEKAIEKQGGAVGSWDGHTIWVDGKMFISTDGVHRADSYGVIGNADFRSYRCITVLVRVAILPDMLAVHSLGDPDLHR